MLVLESERRAAPEAQPQARSPRVHSKPAYEAA